MPEYRKTMVARQLCQAIVLSATALAAPALAEVEFDGTTGPTGSLSGDMVIPDSQGTTVGNNLFHSFSIFNINTGESATFTGPGSIANIISRVTGTSASTINGALEHTVPGADFWFINPNGILFGEQASLPTNGAFHASTADYLRLEDGGRFGADISLPENTVLTVAPPSAFGFLDGDIGNIQVQDSNLTVEDGETLSLVGGDVDITGGIPGQLVAASGTINLAAIASPGEAPVGSQGIEAGDFDQYGDISLTQNGFISVRDDFFGEPGAGAIYIRGDHFVIDNSLITANTFEGTSGDIDIELSGGLTMGSESAISSGSLDTGRAPDINLSIGADLQLSGGSKIESSTDTTGDTGTITVNAANILIEDGGHINTQTFGSGDAGDLDITASDSVVINGDFTTRLASGSGSFLDEGNAGNINVSARALSIDGGVISSESGPFSFGAAGDIHIDTETLTLGNEALLTSATRGGGPGGNLLLNVADSISLSGASAIQSVTNLFGDAGGITIDAWQLSLEGQSLIQSATFQDGNAGDIDIQVAQLSLSNSNISADALLIGTDLNNPILSTGSAGNVTIVASDSIALSNPDNDSNFKPRISSTTFGSGDAGTISVTTPNLNISNGSIDSNTLLSSGNAGDIDINADTVTLRDGGIISTDVGEPASGRGGNISINAGQSLLITGHSPVADGSDPVYSNLAALTLGQGDAGTIAITAPQIEVQNGNIAATTTSSGAAGTITLSGVDTLTLSNGGNIQSGTLGTGAGGNIDIEAANIGLSGVDPDDGLPSGVFATSKGSGLGGNINITSVQTTVSGDATIRSNATSQGNAGNILLSASDQLNLRQGSIETRSDISAGGNITIEAGNMVYLRNSDVTAEAQGVTPGNDGGNISIDPEFIILQNSGIIARANAGNGGNITLVAEALIVDPTSVIDASSATGIDGQVVIETPDRDISSDIVALNVSILDASQLLRKRCAAAALKERSSFTVATEGGLSNSPDVYIGGTYAPQVVRPEATDSSADPAAQIRLNALPLISGKLWDENNDCYAF